MINMCNSIYSIWQFLFEPPDRVAFYTAALVFVTAFLVVVAWIQLASLKKTSRAEFIKKFNDSFFTIETRQLVLLLLNSSLEFSVLHINNEKGEAIDRLPYLRLNKEIVGQLKGAGLITVEDWRLGYNAFEVDDLLLGHLDDVGRYEKNGLLGIKAAYATFGYYFHELLEKDSPAEKMMNDKDNEGNYEDLKYMQKELESYKTVINKCFYCRLYWHVRHWIRRKSL